MEAELHSVEPAVAGLPPPTDVGGFGRNGKLHLSADVDETKTHRIALRRQVALIDAVPLNRLVAHRCEERCGVRIRFQEAGRTTPSVEPEEEGIERRARSALELLGSSLAQVSLG